MKALGVICPLENNEMGGGGGKGGGEIDGEA